MSELTYEAAQLARALELITKVEGPYQLALYSLDNTNFLDYEENSLFETLKKELIDIYDCQSVFDDGLNGFYFVALPHEFSTIVDYLSQYLEV